jgi:hypothetical protein
VMLGRSAEVWGHVGDGMRSVLPNVSGSGMRNASEEGFISDLLRTSPSEVEAGL